MSGYNEPGHEPDYFARVIEIQDATERQSVRIAIRRQLKGIGLSNTSIMQLTDVTPKSSVGIPPFAEAAELKRLSSQLEKIADWRWLGFDKPALPVLTDPLGDLEVPNTGEATTEVRCEDESCTRMVTSNLEVRIKR